MRWLRRRNSPHGQAVVEFSIMLPVIMILVLGMVEIGFAINHNSSIVTATRQGARVGAALVDGGNRKGTGGVTQASKNVDPQIIGAAEGVLISPGSPVAISQVQTIQIFLADSTTGAMTSSVNTWIPAPGHSGPLLPGSSPAQYLDFKPQTVTWDASTRSGAATAQSIGVRITYTYKFITPLGNLVSSFSSGQITMTDQTIMAMEPPVP